jgi:hypothetical protein
VATAGVGAETELPEGLKSLEERRKKLAELAEVARTRDEGSLTMNLKKILSVLSRLRRQTLDALSAAGQQTAEIGLAA